MFPTVKDKVTSLERTKVVEPVELLQQKPQFLSKFELEQLVRQETKTRTIRRGFSTVR